MGEPKVKNKNGIYVFLILLFLNSICFVQAQESVFERKRREYLQNEGEPNLKYYCEKIWAWLEKLKNNEINGQTYYVKDVDGRSKPVNEVIHNIIRCWGNPWSGDGGPTYTWAWKYGPQQSGVMLSWILWQYGNVISQNDYNFIYNLLNDYFRRRDFGTGNPNSQIADVVVRYLWSQNNQSVRVLYSYDPPPNQNIKTFTWEGRSYIPGQEYNSYELCRDLLNYTINVWVHSGCSEFDSPVYTWCYVHCFTALYEWAIDPVMKRKAKMITDLILLESVLDFSANQWGGALGRKYKEVYEISGWDRFYWDVFWDMIIPTHEPPKNIFISSYRLPDVIFDIGDLSDEPDNYYHINKEYNKSIYCKNETGKWNVVTKFYNMGGGNDSEWQLCIKSEDSPGSYGREFVVPFRLWINQLLPGEDESAWSFTSGKNGYQYMNDMLVFGTILHISTAGYNFDIDQMINGWRFLKEGRTMVAIIIGSNTSGVEVAIEGVDYGSFDEFKQAILAKASISNTEFTTSRGDVIKTQRIYIGGGYPSVAVVKKQGESTYTQVWDFPFPRVAAVDYRGNEMVKWVGNNMIVEKNGKRLTYNFDNWTVTESIISSDTVAPLPPNNVSVGSSD